MNLEYYLFQLWGIVVDHGLPLLGIGLTAVLVPRIGRLAVRIIESRLDQDEEATKTRRALVGALVYVVEVVAYFLLALAALSNIGVPPLGAAIPATVISAAVGFGAQSIIGNFLSGFFILSEKQFGVGDYVSFDGATGIEGTVVALTLRTTKVRTPTGEVVTVPNGSAGVVTNYSQDWSRAVVNLAVPVSTGENPTDITAQVERISQEAIKDPQIAPDVVGEVEVLPATGLEAPTAAGLPWQVNYRVMVQVNPARQWAVERGIRSALLNAFWDHYHLAGGELPGLVVEQARREQAGSPDPDSAPDKEPTNPATAETVVLAGPEGASPVEEAEDVAAEQAVLEDVLEDVDDPTEITDGPGSSSVWRDDEPTTRWGKLVTLGGRIRASTTALFVALAVVGLLVLASSNPENASAGWLSPAKWRQTSTPEPTPEPTPETSPAPATEAPVEATEPAPEDSAVPSETAITSAPGQPTEQATPPAQQPQNQPEATQSGQVTPTTEETKTTEEDDTDQTVP